MSNVTLVVSSHGPTLRWSPKHRAVFSGRPSPLKAQAARLHPAASACVGWLAQGPVTSWRARGVSASCYFGMFMPQKVLLNTSKINKPSRPKAAEMTFCGLVAPDFISSLRSKARLLHLTFPLLFQTQEQAVLHLATHRSALQGASSDFTGNQQLSPLSIASLSLSRRHLGPSLRFASSRRGEDPGAMSAFLGRSWLRLFPLQRIHPLIWQREQVPLILQLLHLPSEWV